MMLSRKSDNALPHGTNNIPPSDVKRNIFGATFSEMHQPQVDLLAEREEPKMSLGTLNYTSVGPTHSVQKYPSTSVSRRNERERNRVKLLNLGFERLRAVVPSHSGEQLSKISTLKKAIWYIEHLDRVLHGQAPSTEQNKENTPDEIKVRPSSIHKGMRSNQMNRKTVTSSSTPLTTKRVLKPSNTASVASGLASWSSLDSTTGETDTIQLEGRPVHQNNSPIFPTLWGSVGVDHSSTPKAVSEASDLFNESGYSSWRLTPDQCRLPPKGEHQTSLHSSSLLRPITPLNRLPWSSFENPSTSPYWRFNNN